MLLRQQVLLAFAFLLFTLPAYAEEKGVALTGLNRVALVQDLRTLAFSR